MVPALVFSLFCAAPPRVPPPAVTWSDAQPGEASRMVTLEVLDGDRVTSVWRFPVKPWPASDLARRPAVLPVHRWFLAPHMDGAGRNGMVFSHTWLAGVEADSAFVSFEWLPSEKGDAKPLTKHVLRVGLGETAMLSIAPSVKARATYAPVVVSPALPASVPPS